MNRMCTPVLRSALALIAISAIAQSQFMSVVTDDFADGALDTTKWTPVAAGIPGASVTEAGGVVQLASRAYLRSNIQLDPVVAGDVRVRGLWTWPVVSSNVGTLEVLTRTDAIPDPNSYFEASNGLEFNLWLGPSYTGVAVIQTRGSLVQVGQNTATGTLSWTPGAWYEFEALDAGDHASFIVREVGNPSNTTSVTCAILTGSAPANYVAIHGREDIGGPNVSALDDFTIEVADCNGNLVPDGIDISTGTTGDCDNDRVPDSCQITANPTLDLNTNGILDACECLATNYCIAAPNSTGQGARIAIAGTPSISLNSMTLLCSQLPPNSSGRFFYGPSQIQVPFGNGYRCVGGPIARMPVNYAGPTGTAARSLDLQHPAPGAPTLLPGSTWNFQYWYRNALAGGAGYNLSDGLSVHFCP